MASVDFAPTRFSETQDSAMRHRQAVDSPLIQELRSSGNQNQTGWSLSPKKVSTHESSAHDHLNLRKVHPDIPEDLNRRELMNDSPKRWDLLHQFDKTKQQTRDFLKQALKEETEYDPECTFKPQISEMSELLMRKFSRFDFHERNKHWSTRKQTNISKMADKRVNKEEFPFAPKIIPQAPVYKTGVVEMKQGVKSYLDKINKQKLLKQRDEWIREKRKNRSATPKKGPRITIPMEQHLTVNQKGGSGIQQKFDEHYLHQLRGLEHKSFLESMKNKQDLIEVKNVTYKQAERDLHDQLYGLNLEDYASKIKIKRRLY